MPARAFALAAIAMTACASPGPSQDQIRAEMAQLQTACMNKNANACELYRIKANAIMQASAQNQQARQYTGRALQRAGRQLSRCGFGTVC